MGAPPTNKETLSLPAIRSESLGSSKFKLKLKNNNTMKESIMSFFNAPITNQVPNGVVSIIQLHAYISANEWLRDRTERTRAALDDEKRFASLKRSLLPYVTPAGVFSYRKEDRLLFPSGELVIDIDHLASPEEACTWRDTLFADAPTSPSSAPVTQA